MQHLSEANGPLRSSDFRKALAELQAIRGQLANEADQVASTPPKRVESEDPLAASMRENDLLRQQWQSDVEHLQKELEQIKAQTADAHQEEAMSAEMFRELENLEHALFQERQRAATLLEEKNSIEAAHARDVAALEGMLSQVMDENEKLRSENKQLSAELDTVRAGNIKLGGYEAPSAPKYLDEPEVELSSRSVNVDNNLYPRSA